MYKQASALVFAIVLSGCVSSNGDGSAGGGGPNTPEDHAERPAIEATGGSYPSTFSIRDEMRRYLGGCAQGSFSCVSAAVKRTGQFARDRWKYRNVPSIMFRLERRLAAIGLSSVPLAVKYQQAHQACDEAEKSLDRLGAAPPRKPESGNILAVEVNDMCHNYFDLTSVAGETDVIEAGGPL